MVGLPPQTPVAFVGTTPAGLTTPGGKSIAAQAVRVTAPLAGMPPNTSRIEPTPGVGLVPRMDPVAGGPPFPNDRIDIVPPFGPPPVTAPAALNWPSGLRLTSPLAWTSMSPPFPPLPVVDAEMASPVAATKEFNDLTVTSPPFRLVAPTLSA